jgi:6-phosphogluconolactonase (cycloisomerase 2 family)
LGTNALGVTSARGGRFVYVANYTSRDIWGYRVDATGALHPLPGSPFQLGKPPSIVLAEPSGFLYVTHGAVSDDAGVAAAYTVDPTTGALTPVRGGPFPTGSKPSALAITPR